MNRLGDLSFLSPRPAPGWLALAIGLCLVGAEPALGQQYGTVGSQVIVDYSVLDGLGSPPTLPGQLGGGTPALPLVVPGYPKLTPPAADARIQLHYPPAKPPRSVLLVKPPKRPKPPAPESRRESRDESAAKPTPSASKPTAQAKAAAEAKPATEAKPSGQAEPAKDSRSTAPKTVEVEPKSTPATSADKPATSAPNPPAASVAAEPAAEAAAEAAPETTPGAPSPERVAPEPWRDEEMPATEAADIEPIAKPTPLIAAPAASPVPESPSPADAAAEAAPKPAARPAAPAPEPVLKPQAALGPQPVVNAMLTGEPEEGVKGEAEPRATAVSALSPSDGPTRIRFAIGSADLPVTAQSVLDALAQRLAANDALRVQLLAYASGTPDTESRARRMSLSRALAVRSYLMRQGVRGTRMDVRALGRNVEGEPADRVDIIPQAP